MCLNEVMMKYYERQLIDSARIKDSTLNNKPDQVWVDSKERHPWMDLVSKSSLKRKSESNYIDI